MSDDVSVSDLSIEDIKFLRAVRDINADPGEYPDTDRGKVAANTASIRQATDLGLRKVTYRIGGDHSRGFEQGELGLIKAYSPSLDEESMNVGPRSAELTEKGLELLSELDEEGAGVSGVGVDDAEMSESLKQVKARLDALEGESIDGENAAAFRSEIRSLRDEVESIERRVESVESTLDSEWGALDEGNVGKVETLLERTPPMYYVLQVLFGIDVDAVSKGDGIPDGEVSEWRRDVLQTLQQGASESSERESGSGQASSVGGGSEVASEEGEVSGERESSMSHAQTDRESLEGGDGEAQRSSE